jgi:hypothetical protein
MEGIPLDVYMNAILVNNDIRPAMLVQPQDYYDGSYDLQTILDFIKTNFPVLLFSDKYETYQGIIISKQDYNGIRINLTEMGKILGYPCYDNFESGNELVYAISVIAILEDNSRVQIIPNMCDSNLRIEQFQNIAVDAKKIFKSLNLSFVKDVTVEEKYVPTTSQIINKIKTNQVLSEQDIYKINEIFENLNFEKLKFDNFNYSNELHKGILISMCLNSLYDTLEPFYPLNEKKNKKVSKIAAALEQSILLIIG